MRVFLLALLLFVVECFYLPGVAPHDFEDNEEVPLKVNQLDSIVTQLGYEYYSLPFCKPKEVTHAGENLGEILSGDDIENSAYELFMKKTDKCKVLCQTTLSAEDLAHFATKIEEDYHVNWIVDNIPAGTSFILKTKNKNSGTTVEETVYKKGFPLGFVEDGVKYINNHHKLKLFYHENKKAFKGARIVGFEVLAYSHSQSSDADTKTATCDYQGRLAVSRADNKTMPETTVTWTYSVDWEASDIRWASRWDVYLKMGYVGTSVKVHWFSIANSCIVVIFLAGVIASILCRALKKDLERYNQLEMSDEDKAEETGWKLIHSEVFRGPRRGAWLAVCVGTGMQLLGMTAVALGFAVLGFLSPANRGSLMTAMLLLFILMGAVAGFCSTRLYMTFDLPNWKRNSALTALIFPGITFSIFFVLNLFVWGEHASGAVPFSTLIALLVLWFGISVPLVYVGSWAAYRRAPVEFPCRVANIERLVPDEAPIHTRWYFAYPVAGVVPFAAIAVELFFILSSVWKHQFYYVFGILAAVFMILLTTTAEICVLLVYFQLCYEDYNWWWRSFLCGCSSSIYLFLYAAHYYAAQLQITKVTSTILYFGYTFMACSAFAIMTGTVGFYACYWFVVKIYSSIKVD